jgi:ubiquinone/menaquinone biosynthesis C-methylase UbiE
MGLGSIFGSKGDRKKPWDRNFRACLKEAKKVGRDPNDVLDEEWWGTPSREWFDTYVEPYFEGDDTVVEIGPGSGRFSRFLIDRAKWMHLVDYSAFAYKFLRKYFSGRSNINVVHNKRNRLDGVEDDTVDLVFSLAVFVHIDIEVFVCYLRETFRVLSKGGHGVFHYTAITTPGGLEHYLTLLSADYEPNIMRLNHPQTIRLVAENVGFEIVQETAIPGGERVEHHIIAVRKP